MRWILLGDDSAPSVRLMGNPNQGRSLICSGEFAVKFLLHSERRNPNAQTHSGALVFMIKFTYDLLSSTVQSMGCQCCSTYFDLYSVFLLPLFYFIPFQCQTSYSNVSLGGLVIIEPAQWRVMSRVTTELKITPSLLPSYHWTINISVPLGMCFYFISLFISVHKLCIAFAFLILNVDTFKEFTTDNSSGKLCTLVHLYLINGPLQYTERL